MLVIGIMLLIVCGICSMCMSESNDDPWAVLRFLATVIGTTLLIVGIMRINQNIACKEAYPECKIIKRDIAVDKTTFIIETSSGIRKIKIGYAVLEGK